MTRSLAVEWAKYGIRTNAIARGPPTKGAWDRLMPGDLAEKFDKRFHYNVLEIIRN
jgi:NAD(P)-dependent dehydrogenase (short-subunit alcohol dehydrogenase family)